MPIYEFKCPTCGITMEKLQGFDDPAPTCPKDVDAESCGAPTNSNVAVFERQISPAHPRFKGSGFYINDYP